MKKIKICFVTQQYEIIKNGVGTYIINLINNLPRDKYEITVICPDVSHKKNNGIRLIKIREPKFYISHGSWISLSYQFAKKLREIEKTEKFDIVHFADARESLFYKNKETKIIGSMNDYYFATAEKNPLSYRKFYKDWIIRWAYYNFVKFTEKISLPKLDLIISCADHISKELNRIYNIEKNKIKLVYYGINSKELIGIAKKLKIKKNERPFILFVGMNYQRKGLPTIIRGMPEIIKKFPNVRVKILGKDPNEKKLKEMCKKYGVYENFDFLGYVPYKEALKYFKRSYVFAMPSLKEGFANVFLEALSIGTPVIGGNVGGTKELIKNGVNGFVIGPKNPKEFSEIAIKLLENKKLREKIIREGKKTIKQYSIKRMIDETTNTYKNIL